MSRSLGKSRDTAWPVILFSQNYLPMARINLRRAATLLVTERAEPLTLSGESAKRSWQMRSPNRTLHIPEHIRLTIGGSDRIWKPLPVNRREVLRRDHHRCQYCGSQKQLTLDHVIPRAHGGQHSWNNIVTACAPCNAHKGARTPAQAKMVLLRQPKAPMNPVVAFAEQFRKEQIT
jgi:5-methylcytosine-specific restriction endonuclease McrA